jgi:hypothetical protein
LGKQFKGDIVVEVLLGVVQDTAQYRADAKGNNQRQEVQLCVQPGSSQQG